MQTLGALRKRGTTSTVLAFHGLVWQILLCFSLGSKDMLARFTHFQQLYILGIPKSNSQTPDVFSQKWPITPRSVVQSCSKGSTLKKAECLAYSLGSYLEYNAINHLSSELEYCACASMRTRVWSRSKNGGLWKRSTV